MIIMLAVVIMALIIYGLMLYFKRTNKIKLEDFKSDVLLLVKDSLEDSLAHASKLNLTGESLEELNRIDGAYHVLINDELPMISEMIENTLDDNQHLRLFSVKEDIARLKVKIIDCEDKLADFRKDLKKIKDTTKVHQENINVLEHKYQELNKTLATKRFSYGPAFEKLEKQLKNLEKEFHEYVAVTESGDYIKAKKPLENLKVQTSLLEQAMEELPTIYKNLHNVFPGQIEELKAALDKFVEEKYAFSYDMKNYLNEVEDLLSQNMENVKQLNVNEAKDVDKQIVERIDKAYDTFEKEYSARRHVERDDKYWSDFLNHATKQAHNLFIELERLSQNYELNNNEQEDAEALSKQIQGFKSEYEKYHSDLKEKPILYSEILKKQQEAFVSLKKIEEKQEKIRNSVVGLWKEEKDAWNAVKQFDADIHQLRRRLESLNLPGLSDDYLDYFYHVTAEIENLYGKFNHAKINMEEITNDMIDTQADLDKLSELTAEIVDSSRLAEDMIQYSNRYRAKYTSIIEAQKIAQKQFQAFEYTKAFDTISQAVEQVNPGVQQKLIEQYQAENEKGNI